MTQNDRQYKKICGKIGLVMCLFLAFFNVLTSVASFIYGLLLGVAEAFPSIGLSTTVAEVIGEVLTMLAYFFSFSIPAFILTRMNRKNEGYIPIYAKKGLPNNIFFLVMAAVAVNFMIAFLNARIMTWIAPVTYSGFSSFQTAEPQWHTILLSILSIGVVPALCEEYLFRGAILSALLPYGRSCAIFGSAFLFGMMHQNPYQIFYTMMLGIVLGCIYVRTRSIWCGILIHFVNNSVSVIEDALYQYGFFVAIDMIDILILTLGIISVCLLLRTEHRKRRPEDEGSFGVLFEAEPDYGRYELTKGKRITGFFHPAMIVFVVLAGVSMASVLLLVGGF